MTVKISLAKKNSKSKAHLYIAKPDQDWQALGLTGEESDYIKKKISQKKNLVRIPRLQEVLYIQLPSSKKDQAGQLEEYRTNGNSIASAINTNKHKSLFITDLIGDKDSVLAAAEGVALSNYTFLKYRKDAAEKENSLEEILINSENVKKEDIIRLNATTEAVCIARDLVNEPLSHLTAPQLSERFESMGEEAGFKVEVLNKAKIESLKMGGLLAVNLGSNTPPTFSILEWKPEKPVNKAPIVLVGKGVVYDTGGLSLKPTPNSMDYMKSDMAGAAVVGAAVYALAKMKSPVHVIALVPATDNRPGLDAYVPGDVIKMYNGLTVEVLNTDAEGRMILADALAYAKKFKPELVFDFATLTGAAAAAIGQYGIVCMGTADEGTKTKLKEAGNKVYERLAEFPFWDEYKDLLKSDIADLKNVGGPYGGAITAGKFLEHFIDYPWMHFDIAGPSFIKSNDSYRGKNGTGVGVRMLVEYLTERSKK